MNKVIPIKIERNATYNNTKTIEWRIGNTCNYDCEFCGDKFKSGSEKFFDLETYTKVIDKMFDSTDGKTIWVNINGGEPTLYPKLPELLKYIKTKGGYTTLFTNGSRTIRWWQEFSQLGVVDRMFLSHHPQQKNCNVEHTVKVNNLMQTAGALVSLWVTAPPHREKFDKSYSDFQYILNNAVTIATLRPLSDGHSLLPYSKDQDEKIKNNLSVYTDKFLKLPQDQINKIKSLPWPSKTIDMTYSDGTKVENYGQYFIERFDYEFIGWECDVGKDLVIIEYDTVYRSLCHAGETKSISDFEWYQDSIICPNKNCVCALDVHEPKRKIT